MTRKYSLWKITWELFLCRYFLSTGETSFPSFIYCFFFFLMGNGFCKMLFFLHLLIWKYGIFIFRLLMWCMHACLVTSVVFDFLWLHGPQPARLLCPWDSSGKSTGVGCGALLQGIFLTQGSNPGLQFYILFCSLLLIDNKV